MTLNKFVFILILIPSLTTFAALPPKLSTIELLTQKNIEISTANAEKKGTVYVFLSAKCPCSNSHIQILKNLSTEFSEFQFYAVHSNLDEKKADILKYFKSVKLNFPVLKDENTKLADTFQAFKTPHAFVLNSKAEIIYQGGVTNSSHADSADRFFLKDALTDIRAGRAVKTAEGRTLGCVIMRKDELPQ